MADGGGWTAAEKRAILAIERERERREATRSLVAFGQRLSGKTPPPHAVIMAQAVMCLLTGRPLWGQKVQWLMIFAPPRHLKSWLCSWWTPAFALGHWPALRVMHLTHTSDFAAKMGRRIRNTLAHPLYPFDVRVAGDAQARDQWETTGGGEYNAFGFNGSPTGRPADLLLVDDPLKGYKEADSPVIREHIWEVLISDVWSRLEGPQLQLWVLTRWNEDDPAGRVLPEGFDGRSGIYRDRETGALVHVLCLPAICEHDNDPCGRDIGEWLWPDQHGDGKEIDNQRKRGGRTWAALYQQRPAPMEGLLFQREDLRHYDPADLDALLPRLAIYGASDYAVTAEAGARDPDWTVHTVFGVDPEWRVYVLDQWRGRTTPDKWVEAVLDLARRWKPILWIEEDGQIVRGVGPFLRRRMIETSTFFQRRQLVSAVSKEQRAASLGGIIAMNRLYLPRATPWGRDLEAELLSFPAGKHDDQVDTLSLFARQLDSIMQGAAPAADTAPPPMSLDALWAEHEDTAR